jgi:hypothetical protein
MLIDRYLPTFDATQICETRVDAPPDATYRAIREADLRDPVVNALFAIRELRLRIARKLRGAPPPPAPAKVTFGTITTQGPGWVSLAEEPGVEFVVGSVGRFWRRDYGGRPVAAEEFVPVCDPGYAKLAISFSVRPAATGGTMLRYEARTATTDSMHRSCGGFSGGASCLWAAGPMIRCILANCCRWWVLSGGAYWPRCPDGK